MSLPYKYINKGNSYSFTTNKSIIYEVVFWDLSNSLNTNDEYRVVELSFFPTNNETNQKYDDRISETIIDIVEKFFLHNSDVLLFVCDSNDGRARCRKITFNKWINQNASLKYLATKYDSEISDAGVYSCSIIIGNAHPLKEKIVNDFNSGNLFYLDSK